MEKNSNEDQALSGDVIPSRPDMSDVAEQLVIQAREQGVQLTGSDGLLTALTRQVLETALQTELAEHLGHEHGQPPVGDGGNVRNGSTLKTVRTDIGDVQINVPRDRHGTFEPAGNQY